MKFYAVRDKQGGKYYCVLPNRGFIAWSDSPINAKLFYTEKEAREVFWDEHSGHTYRLPPYPTCEVVTVNFEVEEAAQGEPQEIPQNE